MEETGILENTALLKFVLPDFEPGPSLGLVQRQSMARDKLWVARVELAERATPNAGCGHIGYAHDNDDRWCSPATGDDFVSLGAPARDGYIARYGIPFRRSNMGKERLNRIS
jgi:hypothetical protein